MRPGTEQPSVFTPRVKIGLFIICLTFFGGCSAERPARIGPRALPADSAALLATALRRATPAYRTQDDALRAGVYRSAGPVATASPVLPPPTAPVVPASSPDDVMVRQEASRPQSEITDPSAAARPEYVVQIAAFHDLSSAERAATIARRDLPGIPVRIDRESGLFRVSIGRWLDAEAAGLRLDEIREFYPSAWVRIRSLP